MKGRDLESPGLFFTAKNGAAQGGFTLCRNVRIVKLIVTFPYLIRHLGNKRCIPKTFN